MDGQKEWKEEVGEKKSDFVSTNCAEGGGLFALLGNKQVGDRS